MSFKVNKPRKRIMRRMREPTQSFGWKMNHDSNNKEFKYRLQAGDDVWYARNQKEIEQFPQGVHILWHSKTA